MRRFKTRTHCGSLTEDLLGYNGTRDYPEGKWSKNMDAATFMKFLVYLLQQEPVQEQVAADEIPKGPCTYIVYTWALKGFLYSSFRGQVYTI